jgi:hypothetical protein
MPLELGTAARPSPTGRTSAVDWRSLRLAAGVQEGLLTRSQCLAAGLTDEFVEHRLRTGHWRRAGAGVYQTEPGRSGWPVEVAALLLAHGDTGAMPSTDVPLTRDHRPSVALRAESAATAWGLLDKAPRITHLAVPEHRRVRGSAAITVRRIADWATSVEPFMFPWRTTRARTVIDCAAEAATADDAVTWLARAVQKRDFVPASELLAELGRRPRLRHGTVLRSVLTDVVAGSHSVAEVRYTRDVERAHGLPPARRQAHGQRGAVIHDNDYEPYGVVIEVDGRLGHEQWSKRVKDGQRDRRAAASEGRWTSRVFWPDLLTPCATAVDIAGLLRAGGWSGRPRRCRRAGCAVVWGP